MKLLVTDFDKTLFDDNYYNNIQSINKFAKKGNMFVIATGRTLEQLNNEIKKVNINYSYLICNDGSIIYDKNQKVIKYFKLEQNIKEDFYNIKSLTNYQETIINGETISMKGIILNRNTLKKDLDNLVIKYPSITYNISDNWAQIRNKSVSKGNSIKYIKANFTKIYTAGDQENDIEMLENYNGYAMAGANSNVKEHAKGIINSVEELINIIEKED